MHDIMLAERPRARAVVAGDRARQAAALAAAVAEILASWYVVRTGSDQFARPAPGGDPPLIAAGYAFVIWTPIYAGMLGYAVYQALPRQAQRPLFQASGWPATAAMAGAAAWVLVAQDASRVWWNVAILAGMTVALGAAHRALDAEPRPSSRADTLLVHAPLGLFFGWCTAATFANLAAALRESGLTAAGRETLPSLAMLAGATVAAVAIARSLRRGAWYAGAVTWALVGIAVANVTAATRPPNRVVAVAAGVGALLVLGARFVRRRRS